MLQIKALRENIVQESNIWNQGRQFYYKKL